MAVVGVRWLPVLVLVFVLLLVLVLPLLWLLLPFFSVYLSSFLKRVGVECEFQWNREALNIFQLSLSWKSMVLLGSGQCDIVQTCSWAVTPLPLGAEIGMTGAVFLGAGRQVVVLWMLGLADLVRRITLLMPPISRTWAELEDHFSQQQG